MTSRERSGHAGYAGPFLVRSTQLKGSRMKLNDVMDPVKLEAEIPAALSELEVCIADLQQTARVLEERLESVLISGPEGAMAERTAMHTHMGERIMSSVDRVRHLNHALGSVIQRLAV